MENEFYTTPNNSGMGQSVDAINLRRTQSMRNSMYFHAHLDRQSKKDFWLRPIAMFFKKRKNKINFVCFMFLMMNQFIIMEYSLKIESLWGLSSIGKFYVVLYSADVVGALLSLLVKRVSRKIVNRVHTLLILILTVVLSTLSRTKTLTLPLEIFLLGTANGSAAQDPLLVLHHVPFSLQFGALQVPNPRLRVGRFVLLRQAHARPHRPAAQRRAPL